MFVRRNTGVEVRLRSGIEVLDLTKKVGVVFGLFSRLRVVHVSLINSLTSGGLVSLFKIL